MGALLEQFEKYRLRADLARVRMRDVPEELRPLVECYKHHLTADGPNERHNALQWVRRKFSEKQPRERGNCPRCGGTGHIKAYRHIRGGECLKCGGSGNIGVKPQP